jgi:hypothetical protein
LYGPLVLAADEALLDSQQMGLGAIGVPGPSLAALRVTPEPATGKFHTWPGAQAFRVNAVARKGPTSPHEDARLQIHLVPFADAGETGSAYKIWFPYEPPPPGRNLLRDGVEIRSRKPNAGSIIDDNTETIAVTFNNKRAPQDWFGVEVEEPVTITRVVFIHGKTFHDGGWFDASSEKPMVQVQAVAKGPWETIAEIKNYPAATASDPAGLKGGEAFACELAKPLKVFGVRVVGKPACGDNPKQAFASCAELRAFSGIAK